MLRLLTIASVIAIAAAVAIQVVEWQRDPCAERIARDENIEVSAVLAIVRYLRVVRMVPLRHKRRRMPFIELDIERLREIAEKANDTKATS